MPPFTSEELVRERFQWNDATAVEAELIAAGIDEAHQLVAAALSPSIATEPPPDRLVIGETLLAGALALRALGWRQAGIPARVSVGGQTVERGLPFPELLAMSSRAEADAWCMLAPFLARVAPKTLLIANPTSPLHHRGV